MYFQGIEKENKIKNEIAIKIMEASFPFAASQNDDINYLFHLRLPQGPLLSFFIALETITNLYRTRF